MCALCERNARLPRGVRKEPNACQGAEIRFSGCGGSFQRYLDTGLCSVNLWAAIYFLCFFRCARWKVAMPDLAFLFDLPRGATRLDFAPWPSCLFDNCRFAACETVWCVRRRVFPFVLQRAIGLMCSQVRFSVDDVLVFCGRWPPSHIVITQER